MEAQAPATQGGHTALLRWQSIREHPSRALSPLGLTAAKVWSKCGESVNGRRSGSTFCVGHGQTQQRNGPLTELKQRSHSHMQHVAAVGTAECAWYIAKHIASDMPKDSPAIAAVATAYNAWYRALHGESQRRQGEVGIGGATHVICV